MHIPKSVFLAARTERQAWEDDRGFVYLIEQIDGQEEPIASVVSRPEGYTEADDWPEDEVSA